MDWNLVLSVILSGLGIVFAVLIFLTAFIMLIGKIMASKRGAKQKETRKDTPVRETDVITAAHPADIQGESAGHAGIPTATVAAIAGAIAAFTGNSHPVITSIRKTEKAVSIGTVNPWRAAGIAENTKPFSY